MSSHPTTDQQLTPLGSERTQIDLIARLVRAQQAEIERRYKDLAKANAQHEHFEREWYLRGDEIERLERALTETRDAWTAETTKRLQAVHERDCAVEDVKRLLEAIRLYVRSKKADLGRNALDWWRLQEIEKESAADVPDATPKPNPEEAAIKLTCEDCGTAAWLPKIGREGEFVALKPADGWELYPHRRCPACVAKQSTRSPANKGE